ncbi:M42 glutamyl aminopeptidase [Gracilibacillus ureilyticus]|uniref:M42 glutamyl aminopeptidase n=1 Tax=Gracilibacillus ureilyticus TaxID=531814 RepID=A0A1H9U5E3_9BACI|nr:M20/M25/M40 family metallo-hydrolase [Gracilibacillus ureilyticus]SES04705.1 M42 glutamyl aminopeptidase [Gracilibacillus ureilyticus]
MKSVEKLLMRHGLEMNDVKMTNDYATIAKLIVAKEVQNDHEIIEVIATCDEVRLYGREGSVDPHMQSLPLVEIDSHVRGITRWFNALGIHTTMSCDGHNKRPAVIYLEKPLTFKQKEMLETIMPASLKMTLSGKRLTITYQNQDDLLDFAEILYQVYKDPSSIDYYAAQTLKRELLQLLSINGQSGNERKIRQYVKAKLNRLMDVLFHDRAGNLLGYRYCGEGPTILLSAHLDTVEAFAKDREIIENGTTLTSSEGILGADDRAGIAIILEVLRKIERTNFRGTIKVAFTVKEEIGCVGSSEMDRSFLEDVDAAIVVDRRNTRDIVTSFAGVESFCPEAYGELFEEAGRKLGMPDWKMVEGGSSDARNYARVGVPTVNLSAGYIWEHTEDEMVDYFGSYETGKLVLGVLGNTELINYSNERKKILI